jgi:glycosyltransferase involved in cell wall biosynthesis
MPLVSVVVPTHNRPGMLAEALASVRLQTFTNYEVIVVSNGESEEMRVLSRACATRYGAMFELPEGNVSAARNFAVAQAKGEWIAFLDDDDLWLPHKLDRQLAEAGRTGADMIVCDCVYFNHDSGRELCSGPPVRVGWQTTEAINHQRWGAIPSAVLVRKAAVEAAGGFDPGQRYGEDLDLWRRIAWRHSIHQMDDVLVRYRRHSESTSLQTFRVFRYDLRNFVKMWRDTPADLRWALPSPLTIARRWLLRSFMPRWLRQPKKAWQELRPHMLAAMTAIAGFVGR